MPAPSTLSTVTMALLTRAALASCVVSLPLRAQEDSIVQPPSPPAQVAVERIEANQGIQNAENLVPLLAGRTTWIRVYVSGPAEIGPIHGRLRVAAAGRETTLESIS